MPDLMRQKHTIHNYEPTHAYTPMKMEEKKNEWMNEQKK